jgi:hypothetical protein
VAQAPGPQTVVDQLGAVVGVQLSEQKRQPLLDVVKGCADTFLAHAPDWQWFSPACGDVNGCKGRQKEAFDTFSAVKYEVRLQRARRDLCPFAPGANGDLSL